MVRVQEQNDLKYKWTFKGALCDLYISCRESQKGFNKDTLLWET